MPAHIDKEPIGTPINKSKQQSPADLMKNFAELPGIGPEKAPEPYAVEREPVNKTGTPKPGDEQVMPCPQCGRWKNCTFGSDPLMESLYGDTKPQWACDDCNFESSESI